jgi:anthranilate/para-aminobenzoate synthase component II
MAPLYTLYISFVVLHAGMKRGTGVTSPPVARYHSLYGIKDSLPDCLAVTATTADGVIGRGRACH